MKKLGSLLSLRTASALAAALAAALVGLAGCSGQTQLACKKDPITGSEQCQPTTSSGGEAAVGAAVAGAAWVAAGCRVNGCVGPYRCNQDSGACDPIPCNENSPCPGPYVCNFTKRQCE